jgi:hypothetical protein
MFYETASRESVAARAAIRFPDSSRFRLQPVQLAAMKLQWDNYK